MNEPTRHWAKLEDWHDGRSARYLLPTPCQECNLELHVWTDPDDSWSVQTVLPVHKGTFWWRLKNGIKYVWSGYWPSGDFPLLEQDWDNLIDLLTHIKKEKK